MICVECGFRNSEAANFCARCGASQAHADEQVTSSYDQDELAGPESAPLLSDSAVPVLVIRSGAGRDGETFVLSRDVTAIGRSPEDDVFLDDVSVSRSHARIYREAGGFHVRDTDSLNGTYVNRRRVESHRLSNGDELIVGRFRLVFLDR
jgi:hypothetical protein